MESGTVQKVLVALKARSFRCRKYKPNVVRHKSDPVKQLHIESCAVPKRTPVYPASREWVKWPKASICSTSSQRWREGEHTDSTKETTWRIV
jgi:hypothetical protein